jgi:hypothetical protein
MQVLEQMQGSEQCRVWSNGVCRSNRGVGAMRESEQHSSEIGGPKCRSSEDYVFGAGMVLTQLVDLPGFNYCCGDRYMVIIPNPKHLLKRKFIS